MVEKRTSLSVLLFSVLVLLFAASRPLAEASRAAPVAQAVQSHPGLQDGARVFMPMVSRKHAFPVTGHVQDQGNNPVPGAIVSAGAGVSTTTSASGSYTLLLPAGSYTLTVSKGDKTFTPASWQISLPPEASGQDFTCTNCVNPLPSEMVLVPPGNFTMGCVSGTEVCPVASSPQHTVYVSAYEIDKYEVTNARYKACVDSGGCSQPGMLGSANRASYFGNPDFDNYPVIYVDWSQASAFCQWDGKRLPTEAEWEKAARGSSDTRMYPWGDGEPNCSLGNFFGNTMILYCVGETSAVGSYPAGVSPYGALDMAGNVLEWVSDWFQDTYYSSQTTWIDPIGPVEGSMKVLRGGNYGSPWRYIRVFARGFDELSYRNSSMGFRCARSR